MPVAEEWEEGRLLISPPPPWVSLFMFQKEVDSVGVILFPKEGFPTKCWPFLLGYVNVAHLWYRCWSHSMCKQSFWEGRCNKTEGRSHSTDISRLTLQQQQWLMDSHASYQLRQENEWPYGTVLPQKVSSSDKIPARGCCSDRNAWHWVKALPYKTLLVYKSTYLHGNT